MNLKDEIKYLNRMEVKGFYFRLDEFEKMTLIIPYEKAYTYDENEFTYNNDFGWWKTLNEMFLSGSRFVLDNLIYYISESKQRGSNARFSKNPINFLDVNDSGVEFLKCLVASSSMEEFELRLQILGYDI